MQELEKILEEMRGIKDGNRKEKLYAKYPPNSKDQKVLNAYSQGYEDGTDNFYNAVVDIIRKYMNDGWIPVEERLPEKEYSTVLCVTDKNHYFVGVYNRKKRFRTGDIYAEGEVIAWMPLEPYRSIQPETCKYTGGACCWPIDQCKDCPNHPGKKCWEQEVNADGK